MRCLAKARGALRASSVDNGTVEKDLVVDCLSGVWVGGDGGERKRADARLYRGEMASW